MPKYITTLVHGRRGGEGRYEFDAEEKLLDEPPVCIMRTFMDSIEQNFKIGHIDYQINTATKDQRHGIVTVTGDIIFERGDHQPFMCMIHRP